MVELVSVVDDLASRMDAATGIILANNRRDQDFIPTSLDIFSTPVLDFKIS